jgi:hypothetical protein
MNLLSHLIAPLQVVVLFFAPHAATVKPQSVSLRTSWRSLASSLASTSANSIRCTDSTINHRTSPHAARITYPHTTPRITAHPIHRVRVVRNVDKTLPADRAGRMVVSGRFADVCAELDRLAASDMRAA